MHKDFKDLLCAFNAHNLLIGRRNSDPGICHGKFYR
jgi:hypothetical protein